MMINEGLPHYLISRLEKRYHLEFLTVGILGMAFKAESDDMRSSLSYKLKRILSFKAADVLCTDPYVTCDEDLLPLDEVIAAVGPARDRRSARSVPDLDTSKPIVDIWNLRRPRRTGVTPRISVVVTASTTRATRSFLTSTGFSRRSRLPCEVLVVYDTCRRHDRPGRRGVCDDATTGSFRRSTRTARVRHGPSSTASTTPLPTWSSSPWRTAATIRRRSKISHASSSGASSWRRRRAT